MLLRSALVAVFFFGAALASAQPPTDALRAKAYAPLPAARKFLAENPGLVEERRTENAIHYRLPGGGRRAILSPALNWTDPESGRLVPVEPVLWTLDNGWRLEGGPVKIRVVPNGSAWALEFYRQRPDKQWKSLSFAIPRPSRAAGLEFSFDDQKLTWKLRLNDFGFELTAAVATRQGRRTYSFAHVAKLLDLSPDAATGDLAGDDFRLSRAVMVRRRCVPFRQPAFWNLPALRAGQERRLAKPVRMGQPVAVGHTGRRTDRRQCACQPEEGRQRAVSGLTIRTSFLLST